MATLSIDENGALVYKEDAKVETTPVLLGDVYKKHCKQVRNDSLKKTPEVTGAKAPEGKERYEVYISGKFAFRSNRPVGDRVKQALAQGCQPALIVIRDTQTNQLIGLNLEGK